MVAFDASEALGEIGSASVQLFCKLGRGKESSISSVAEERPELPSV